MSSVKEVHFINNPITSDDIKKLEKVFTSIEADPQAYDFLEPVDYVALNILDYPSIIKTPMDLGTVKSNLKDKKYPTFLEFLSDIDLIWTNCRTYNMAGSEIVKMANHCEKAFKKLIEKQFKNYMSKSSSKNEIEDNDSTLTMEQKMKLTDKIRVLSNEGLTQVVKLIMKECQKGIEDVDSEKLQIKIDLIDHKTYTQLLETIDNCMKDNDKDKSNK